MKINISEQAFNDCYLPLLRDERHRYLVLYGGAGSGKSVFAAQRFLVRLLEQPLCNLLVVRAVAKTNRDSTYALFRQIIQRWDLDGLFHCTSTEPRICCTNGNTVVFRGLDDVEKLKSITFPKGELTDIWIEEASEITQEDFNQLDVRLRGQGSTKQIVLTFNPISAVHWLKRRFFDRPDDRAHVMKTTYAQNRFLDDAYVQTLEGYRDSDPYYYGVYCLGEWGVLGNTVFHAQKVTSRLSQLRPPLSRGEFTFSTYYHLEKRQVLIDDSTIAFVPDDQGPISIYKEPDPAISYVIGGDTAGEGSDFFTGQVINAQTGEQVCTLRQSYDEDLYAKQLYCLGKYYQTALLSVEVNFSTYPVRELERLGYPRQFVRIGEDSFTHRPKESYGFRTTSVTRPLILAALIALVREQPQLFHDRATLEEMLTFVRSESGRPQAQQGAHDDCIMALAIAWYSRCQQSPPRPSTAHWTPDMEEDYRNASPQERRMLREKWGSR